MQLVLNERSVKTHVISSRRLIPNPRLVQTGSNFSFNCHHPTPICCSNTHDALFPSTCHSILSLQRTPALFISPPRPGRFQYTLADDSGKFFLVLRLHCRLLLCTSLVAETLGNVISSTFARHCAQNLHPTRSDQILLLADPIRNRMPAVPRSIGTTDRTQ